MPVLDGSLVTLFFATDIQEVVTETENTRITRRLEQNRQRGLIRGRIMACQIRYRPLQSAANTFRGKQGQRCEAKLAEERCNLFWLDTIAMAEASGNIIFEPPLIEELRHPSGVLQMLPLIGDGQRATDERKARHKRDKRKPLWTQDTGQFSRSALPIIGIGQVVERPQAEHGIKRFGDPSMQITRIGFDHGLDVCFNARLDNFSRCNAEQLRREIGKDDPIAALG